MCRNQYLEQLALKYPEFRELLEHGVLPDEIVAAEVEATQKEKEEKERESYGTIF